MQKQKREVGKRNNRNFEAGAVGEDGRRYIGNVKWFNKQKGFGFITCEEFNSDVFVHYSVIDATGYRELFEGDLVEFGIIHSQKGLSAVSVRQLETAAT